MTRSNKKMLALAVVLGTLLGAAYTVNAAPAPTMAPARGVAMAPARPAPRPVAKPAPVMTTTPVMAALPAMAVVPAAPVMAAPAPAEPAMAADVAVPEKVASAPVVKKDTKGAVVGGWALQIVLYLLGIFLTAFIPVFTAWLYKKFKLTNLEQKDKIDQMVLKAAMFGIGKAEEAAHKLKDNPMESAKKLDLAIATTNKYLVDSGLPEKGVSYLADLIESKLGESRKSEVKELPASLGVGEVDEDKSEDTPKEDAAKEATK